MRVENGLESTVEGDHVPKPTTPAEHLARLVPASAGANGMGRRGFLRAAALTGLAASSPALLAACGDGGSGGGGGGSKPVTVGSNEKGTGFAKQRTAEIADFMRSSGLDVELNEVDHNTFQENISTYLQGNPDDVFTWFAGYRLEFFADQGLIGDISDAFPVDGLPESFEKQSSYDGKQYLMPQNYYPWAVFYRKSLWAERGYEVPATYDELKTLSAQMQTDGLTPFAFGESDGWPAMGTFDILNMRINGYQYHIDLMKHEESWDSPRTKAVFDTWRDLLPLHQSGANGRTWQEAAQSLLNKESGMYTIGTFVNEQFGEEEEDLDFFTFPEIDPAIGADALDAPIDGWCMSSKPRNEEGALKLLEYLGSPEAAAAANSTGLNIISPNENSSTEPLTALQKKSVEVVGSAKNLAQFLDRDTRPDFASTVMIPALKNFVDNPDDVDGLVKKIESQAKTIFV